jgi:hypothetical protein
LNPILPTRNRSAGSTVFIGICRFVVKMITYSRIDKSMENKLKARL